jgi:hypothetical protein
MIELAKKATSLRNGISCEFQPDQHIGEEATMGCANYHGWIKFSDGEKWVVRMPRPGLGNVPNEPIEY